MSNNIFFVFSGLTPIMALVITGVLGIMAILCLNHGKKIFAIVFGTIYSLALFLELEQLLPKFNLKFWQWLAVAGVSLGLGIFFIQWEKTSRAVLTSAVCGLTICLLSLSSFGRVVRTIIRLEEEGLGLQQIDVTVFRWYSLGFVVGFAVLYLLLGRKPAQHRSDGNTVLATILSFFIYFWAGLFPGLMAAFCLVGTLTLNKIIWYACIFAFLFAAAFTGIFLLIRPKKNKNISEPKEDQAFLSSDSAEEEHPQRVNEESKKEIERKIEEGKYVRVPMVFTDKDEPKSEGIAEENTVNENIYKPAATETPSQTVSKETEDSIYKPEYHTDTRLSGSVIPDPEPQVMVKEEPTPVNVPPVPVEVQTPTPTAGTKIMAFCPYCGTKLPEGSAFCIECGNKLML